MKKQITHIAPIEAAKIITPLTLILSFLYMAIASARYYYAFPEALPDFPIKQAIITLLIYTAVGCVGSLISAALYNWLAKLIGGIEFTVEEKN